MLADYNREISDLTYISREIIRIPVGSSAMENKKLVIPEMSPHFNLANPVTVNPDVG
jgi:hypothetical protein